MKKRLVKFLAITFALVIAMTGFVGCDIISLDGFDLFKKSAKEIVFDDSDITIREGEEYKLKDNITILPKEASNNEITWESSNTSVAKVSASGVVTGVSCGKCVIYVQVDDINTHVYVTVKKSIDFEALYNKHCKNRKWAELGNDGSYLYLDTNPNDTDGGDYQTYLQAWPCIEVINDELGLPDSLENSMNTTTWSMGKQTETYEDIGVKVTWTYHPDLGLEVRYELI